jgi:hypothetical protein
MSDYMVLAAAGESLLNVLWEEIQNDPAINALINSAAQISLQSPYDLRDNDAVRLSIYLYRIVEDPHTKNQYPVRGNGDRLRKPPLTLDLYYMVTPLVGLPREQHIVLGKVMQVLYDRAILQGLDLVGTLANSAAELRVILNSVNLEENTRVWQALEMSYRLSVCYIVRVVLVDSLREQTVIPVIEKTSRYGEKL